MTRTLDPVHGCRRSVSPITWRRCRTVALGEATLRLMFGAVAASVVFISSFAAAEPFVPKEGGQILERLRATIPDAEVKELRKFRKALEMDPQNFGLAAQYARKCIERSRYDAEPRYLGRAEAALAPWLNNSEVPAEALVLRATIKQSQHDFTNALVDLDMALKRAPRDVQAWLTRATILTVLGDYAAARRACIPLAQLAPGLLALTAAANVTSLNGEADRACALLVNALATSAASANEKLWAFSVLGEVYARLGNDAAAQSAFKRALELEPHDTYVLCSYADLLLDLGRADEAAALLKDAVRSDGVLLRLALAERELKPKTNGLKILVATLRNRFEAGHLRGDFVHQREEARFALRVLGKPEKALRVALDNWRSQREPADARILVESALAAQKPAAALAVLEFVKDNHIEDVRLQALVDQVEKSKVR